MATTNENPMREKEDGDDEVYVFPDLVYIEFIALLLATLVLLVWSMAMDAPLRGIADPNTTENPAKAPWYFVGLQELLVYFDPWIAGVIIPGVIVVGLVLIPYLDTNTADVGRYRFRNRKIVITHFMFGYILWFVLIVIGQFLRGPNWQWYWPWESWEIAKSAESALVNMPVWAGVGLLVVYFGGGLAVSNVVFNDMRKQMGKVRYLTAWTLVLLMYFVVVKVFLRLVFGVKYVLVTPWFNI